MVKVQCPHCQRRYRTKVEAFGVTAVCTKCHRAFKIGESRPPFAWKSQDLAEDSWIGVPPPEERQEMKHCIICDAPLPPEALRCPECGANQVTGVVHRSRTQITEEKIPFGAMLPWRSITVVAVLLVLGLGVYWGIRAISRSAQQLGDEVADTTLATQVARQLRDGADEYLLAEKHVGAVSDANLPRLVGMLSARDPYIRRAAILLIGAGRATQLESLVAAARSESVDSARAARDALLAFGPRQLTTLSNHADSSVRQSAATALVLLFGLDQAVIARLSEPSSDAEKIQRLNELCRPWPLLTGGFHLLIADTPAPFAVQVQQVGKVFYLKAGTGQFMTPDPQERRFLIPLHRWCLATGSAVDPERVRELIDGTVQLAAPVGAAWEGQVQVSAKTVIRGPLPGFLPIEPPQPGRTAEAPMELIRPG
ncbi:MAG: hypothetical protein AMXMBFR13_00500 [Phycisphaerae bacterium]